MALTQFISKLRKTGNSFVITVPFQVIDAFGLSEGITLSVHISKEENNDPSKTKALQVM